jgi:putative membrane protein
VTERFPARVYGVGEEPDPRFTLANERTFLAWIRTALALSAAGVALVAVDVPIAPPLQTAAAAILVCLGLMAAAQAWWRWGATERALRLSHPLPGSGVSPVVAGGGTVVCLLLIVGLILR